MTTIDWSRWNTSYTDDRFGPMQGGQTVQEAVYNTIQTWIPAYVAEMNRQLGITELQIPKEYRFRPDYVPEPSDEAPRVLVLVHGLIGVPERFQTNLHSHWEAEVSTYIYGPQDWQYTQALTMAYTTCIRTLLVQQGSLGTVAETTKWTGEKYLEGEHSSTMTRGLGICTFDVCLSTTFDPTAGPPSPTYGPPGSWLPTVQPPTPVPTVDTTNVEVTNDG
jgi:hypothetical protein